MTAALAVSLAVSAVLLVTLLVARASSSRRLEAIRQVIAEVRGGNPNRRLRSAAGGPGLRAVERELNALTAELQRTLLEKQKADAARRLMVSHISHDLRTPLTSMVGYIDALIADQTLTPEEGARFLGVVKAKCRLLSELIDDLFELSRLEAETVQPAPEKLELCALAEGALLAFHADFERLAIEPEIDLPGHPVYVSGNRRYVERILSNLISNVLRHGSGATRVAFSILEKPGLAACSLSDNGSGIPPAELPFLFVDPWSGAADPRAGDTPAREPQSSRGLGLAIVKRLAEAMGGAAEAESDPGRSTVFRLTLPAWREPGGGPRGL